MPLKATTSPSITPRTAPDFISTMGIRGDTATVGRQGQRDRQARQRHRPEVRRYDSGHHHDPASCVLTIVTPAHSSPGVLPR
jgi:hypothetical protein